MKFMKLGSKPDLFQTNGKDVRFVGTELETDLIVNVGDLSFYLHKFPLLSKSSLLQRLVNNNSDDNDVIELNDIPGGASAFEICAKFCYGMTVTLNAYNVISAYCGAEYLEMNETTEKGNLIYKIEVFLNTSIFRSWKDSIIVIQTTKSLIPYSEDSKLVNHCIDSIACKASVDSSKVDWSYTYNRRNDVKKQQSVPKDWWVEDLCELDLELYKHVINAIKSKGKVSDKVIGEALKAYTCRRLPGFAKGNIIEKNNNTKGRALLETIIKLLPKEKRSVSCSFLTRLLRFATSLNCNEACVKGLVKKTGSQLDEALLHDLLLCGVDIVLNLVEEFVKHEEDDTPDINFDSSKLEVAKLVDAYLAEIAKDQGLPISKFLALAEMVPSDSRPVHDGLYRAIDMYMKEHGNMTKSERKKLCNLMDCKKLTRDACAHAVQNERLPLRTVVQVLFFEQSRASGTSSYGSSRSAATSNTTNTTDDNWGAASIPEVADSKGSVKGTKGIVSSKKVMGKVKSNSSSDTCSSQDDLKATPLRKLSISRG